MNNELPHIFIVAGMPRSGTTFLYYNFQNHPNIFTSPIKETNFFSSNYSKGKDWFKYLYNEMYQNQIGCDVSPLYFLDKLTINRIRKNYKDIKIILAIREPIEFTVSLYNNLKTWIWNMPPFEEFIESFRLKKGVDYIYFQLKKDSIVSILNKFRETFDDNLLFYSFDLFKRKPLFVLQSIETYIGIQNYFNEKNFDDSIINPTKSKNIKLISHLSDNEAFISFLNKALPPKFFNYTRQVFYKLYLKKRVQRENQHSQEFFEIVEKAFGDHSSEISELFKQHEMLLGSGAPFPEPNI